MNQELRAVRITGHQRLFFPRRSSDVCVEVGLNKLAAKKLHEDGWLSFDPEGVTLLDEGQEAELVFIGALVAAGCDDRLLDWLLQTLEKPYCYRLDEIYYEWASQCWRALPQPRDDHAESTFNDWLGELTQRGDTLTLSELQWVITDALRRAKSKTSAQ